ncbi:hypothetical protein CASFOL_018250 [Castilleja foliolosa]|uniref:Uncharacterized protein n=1 Tax=Castilleja foliolosa TaxID=1961234 RepID=A0ABD3DAK4_9LAMI
MAIEFFPDSPNLGMSPRISFSYDLHQSDVVPVEQYVRTSSPSSIDFDFCVFRESFDQDQSSSADELFFDGKILPIEVKRRLAPPPRKMEDPPPPPRATAYLRPPTPKKIIINEPKNATNSESEEKHKSFWRFKRSTSLNCGSGYGRTLCPLPLLSRSNSTGSSAGGKRQSVSNSQKQSFLRGNSSNTSQKQTQTGNYSCRPPLKKNLHGSSSNGVKFNPVLQFPPANFFGLGSFFSGGRGSSKKK